MPRLHGSEQIFERPKPCRDTSVVYREPAEACKFLNCNSTAICDIFCTVSCKRLAHEKNIRPFKSKLSGPGCKRVSAARLRRQGLRPGNIYC